MKSTMNIMNLKQTRKVDKNMSLSVSTPFSFSITKFSGRVSLRSGAKDQDQTRSSSGRFHINQHFFSRKPTSESYDKIPLVNRRVEICVNPGNAAAKEKVRSRVRHGSKHAQDFKG